LLSGKPAVVNLRHAAALGLVGWYLMMPPIPQDPLLLADPTPPLSVWFLQQSFDTAKECERARKAEDHEAELQMHDLAKSHAIEHRPRAILPTADIQSMHRDRRSAPQGKVE